MFLRKTAASLLLLVSIAHCAPPSDSSSSSDLLNDDFSGLQTGMFSGGVVGALTEYHYLSAAAPKGNWVVSAFRSDGSQRAWRIIVEDGRHIMSQTYTSIPQERTYTHPIVIAGDDLWGDYTLETKFAPEVDDGGISGVVFRYRTDRKYYFLGVAGQKAILRKLNDGVGFRKMDETILAEKPLTWKPGEYIPLRVTVTGDHIVAMLGHDVTLEAHDAAFAQGKIGLVSDMPARFGAVRVSTPPSEFKRFQAARDARQNEEDRLVAANPKMVLWKKFRTTGFGVGRNVRFGDLNGDGKIDVLIAQQKRHGPADGHSEVGCLTAMTLDGEILWQNGIPDSWNHTLTNDVAVQIYDIDGDGKNEVIYCRDFEIVVADGATGKTKYKAQTPISPPDPLRRPDHDPRILGDALYFCDLRGTGAARDIILKDRYWHVWAYTDKLEPLWDRALNTGHYPFAYDVDKDGKDELVVGYSLLGHDGKTIWTLKNQLQDHADGVAIVRFREDQEPRVLGAASDEGFYLADLKGNFLKHYQIGHVQNPSVADYRPDLPGLETITVNFWGNQGIVHMFNADGEIYHEFEPSQHGSMMSPVNWTGQAGEFWALSANPIEGGLFDGWGRRVVRFPSDGHPDMCCAVLDVTGDCRDELIVWDPWEMWIYTQSDSPKSGKLYKPKRNPTWNMSNYQTTVSLPGWSE
jgi:hypothetical protein